jgi:SpoVK/Ycf46/Vps4 family AAA+-type ATPase
MILFIDEADAFFRDRDNNKMSESLRNSINAFLHRSGTPSRKVLFVAATNMPHQLDAALLSRVDQCIHFPLPEQE